METALRLVGAAERSVYLVSAWLGGEAVGELIQAVKPAVEVEVVLRASSLEDLKITSERSFRYLNQIGAKIFLCKKLHSKFLIVDEREALVGSANFTSPGLSITPGGNVETVLHLRRDEDPELFEKLLTHYREIRRSSFPLEERLLGFVINPSEVHRFTFLTFEGREPPLHSFVEVPTPKGFLLGEVVKVRSLLADFPLETFRGAPGGIFADGGIFELFTEEVLWNLSLLFALKGKKESLYEVVVRPLVVVAGESFLSVSKPPTVGSPVYLPERERIEKLFKLNGLLREARRRVNLGRVPSGFRPSVDLDVLAEGHLAVLGTTGSGKSHLVKLLLTRICSNNPFEGGIHVIDPHGEYPEDLRPCLGTGLNEVPFEDTLLPSDGNALEEILKESGFGYWISGPSSEARKNRDLLHSAVRPTLKGNPLREEPLKAFLEGLLPSDLGREVVKTLSHLYGKEALENQPEELSKIEENLKRNGFTVWNLSRVSDRRSASTLVGLIVGELFSLTRRDGRRRLLVVEESHLFAPERGYGELPSGRNLLSLVNLVKVASQGRKFKLSLVVVGQRPAQISKFVLSQMNNQVLFRMVGKGDLEACATFLPSLGEGVIELLPALRVGEAFLNGPFVFSTVRIKVDNFKSGCGGGI